MAYRRWNVVLLPEKQDTARSDGLWPLVYDELRRLATLHLRSESPDHTLQPTALVHEAYMRMMGDVACTDGHRFFATASQAMRRVLVDHARRRLAAKRGGDRKRVAMDAVGASVDNYHAYLIALDDALSELACLDLKLSQVVELRFFGGLSIDEAAQVLGVSAITVSRRWKAARAWLHSEILET